MDSVIVDRSPALEMRGISKSFGATHALSDVSLEARGGQVLALIGENGAGKSTLMKVLSGAHRADGGEMSLSGKTFAPRGPVDARLAGVAMIYQELNLAPHLSVADNITLGREPQAWGCLDRVLQRQQVSQAKTPKQQVVIESPMVIREFSPFNPHTIDDCNLQSIVQSHKENQPRRHEEDRRSRIASFVRS